MNKLVLIDGHAILHRAYHALPPLTNKSGVQTNAVYGFMTMLLQMLDNVKPTHLAVAFDLPTPTFRQQQYTQYQARRPEMESNLAEQIPLVHELLDKLEIPYFEVAGFEADDVIGTLASQAVRSPEFGVRSETNNKPSTDSRLPTPDSLDVIIVTGDRDMLQLINENVKVCVPVKGLVQTKIYDADTVVQEFGVEPNQWVDVKALKGDASDNYPGVRGIGPKTAQELIGIYGTLEEVYKNLGKLNPKTAKKLAEGVESAGVSQKLAKIVCDVPLKLNLMEALVEGIRWEDGVDYMRNTLGFRSVAEKIEKKYLKKSEPNFTKASPGKQLGLI